MEEVPGPNRRALPRKVMALAIALLIIMVVLAVPFVFLEGRALNINEQRAVPEVPGAERIELNVMASVGELDVSFAPLDGKAVEVTALVEGRAGYLGQDEPLNLTVDYTDDVASGGNTIRANVTFDAYAPWPYYSINRTHFSVVVDSSLRADLDLKVVTGGIVLSTIPGVELEGLSLNATKEGAVVSLNNGTVLSGDVWMHTATGGTQFRWYNVSVMNYPTVTLSESSGIINATFSQHTPLNGSMAIMVVNGMGDVKFNMDMSGINSAYIRTNKDAQLIGDEGFVTETPSAFHSANYPSDHTVNVRLNVTNSFLGGITVDGRWAA